MHRVKTWCQFTWSSQKSFDERAILQYLPGKMMTGNAAIQNTPHGNRLCCLILSSDQTL